MLCRVYRHSTLSTQSRLPSAQICFTWINPSMQLFQLHNPKYCRTAVQIRSCHSTSPSVNCSTVPPQTYAAQASLASDIPLYGKSASFETGPRSGVASSQTPAHPCPSLGCASQSRLLWLSSLQHTSHNLTFISTLCASYDGPTHT